MKMAAGVVENLGESGKDMELRRRSGRSQGGARLVARHVRAGMLTAGLVCLALVSMAGCDSGSSPGTEQSCENAQVFCGGQCVDPETNTTNCGAIDDCAGDNAGVQCGEGETCVAGICTPPGAECQTDQVLCGDKCIDPGTDNSFCGATGDCLGANAGAECTESATCQAGLCKPEDPGCKVGEVLCDGQCIDPQTEADFCGASGDCAGDKTGKVCAQDETCVEGLCVPPACDTNQVRCDGNCIDPQTEAAFCGASGDCAGDNVGVVCGQDETCEGGLCIPPACEGDLVRCNGNCIDPGTDLTHCGAIGDCSGGKRGAGL